jgi:ABC-2 type transport system ATP-binding protein
MDEPTTGLDPRSKKETQAVLESLRAEREITVLLCTHDMDEAAALCDRVLMMDGGRVLADDSPAKLQLEYEAASLESVFMHLTGKTLAEEEEPAEVAP